LLRFEKLAAITSAVIRVNPAIRAAIILTLECGSAPAGERPLSGEGFIIFLFDCVTTYRDLSARTGYRMIFRFGLR
jgi:hypothetical protein